MTKLIPVKYGIEIFVITILPFLFMISESIPKEKSSTIIFSFGYLAFVLLVIFGISYRIEGNRLIITNFFFWKTVIDINQISKVEKTWNLITSPAPSITGRVEIYWNRKSIVISPKFYEDFKNELLRINSNIDFKN